MKNLIVLLSLFISLVASADLLDRIKLEDSFKNRLEDALSVYDDRVKVFIRFDFKTYNDTLPGTSIDTQGGYGPLKVESSDIQRVNIDIFMEKEPVPEEAKAIIPIILPIERSKLNITYKKMEAKKVVHPRLDPEALSGIADKAVQDFIKFLTAIVIGAVALILGAGWISNRKSTEQFKQQLSAITAAISDLNFSGAASAPDRNNEAARSPTSAAGATPDKSTFDGISSNSLRELLADCYWCREDSYAAWIWKQLDTEQRKSMLTALPFMKDYSQFFITMKPAELNFHQHPYYLDPSSLSETSQDDLKPVIEKNNAFWHQISPLRQQNLPLSFEQKLSALQSKPGKELLSATKAKSFRTLEAKPSWGQLSETDEQVIFQNPDIVPLSFRNYVPSLLWLAKREPEYVQAVLAKFDAKSLAQAWIGPHEVLETLEKHLPEKKLKMLQGFKTKVSPSRSSYAFTNLVQEGLKNEAA